MSPPRGRRPGAHIECDFLNDPRVMRMSAADWTVYSKLWILAVGERSEVIDRRRWSDRLLARKLCVNRRTLVKSLKRLSEPPKSNQDCTQTVPGLSADCPADAKSRKKCTTYLELLCTTPDTITVIGVKNLHSKMDWKTWSKSAPNESPLPEPEPEPKPEPKSTRARKSRARPSDNGYSTSFETAWAAWPERVNNPKRGAYKQWQRLVRAGVTESRLVASARNYAQWCTDEKKEDQFVLMAQTFFGEQGRWEGFEVRPKSQKELFLEEVRARRERERTERAGGGIAR